ncbi:MAG: molybdenum cofactor biosynthesis protein MoaE [Myxococcota bacterium]
MIAVVDGPIDTRAVEDAVRDEGNGALLTFSGVGRNSFGGRPVAGLFYEAWDDVALKELRKIADEVREKWPGARIAMVHRTGEVAIGEPSVVIAVGTPHRDAAYAASRYAIDELKQRVPIWKKERYADGDGDAWIANEP